MKNKIFTTRTDLIIENDSNKIVTNVFEKNNISITKSIYKGTYYSLYYKDLSNVEERTNLIESLTYCIKDLLKANSVKDTDFGLIIGLGNSNSTPDSLGPISLDNIIVTKYLYDNKEIEVNDKYRNIAAFSPNVTGVTGLDTLSLLRGIIKEFKPNFIIAIDALASTKIERVLKVIQVTDTGIHPGSGVGNNRGEISKKTFKIPVIAIGVPTVIDAVTLVKDTIKYLYQKISYTKENINKEKLSKMSNNHKETPDKLDNLEKEKLFGLIGSLTESDLQELLIEVLVDDNLIVTPKEIDFDIEKLSLIISTSINNSVHFINSTNN